MEARPTTLQKFARFRTRSNKSAPAERAGVNEPRGPADAGTASAEATLKTPGVQLAVGLSGEEVEEYWQLRQMPQDLGAL
jgi:hypothetical protein